MVRYKNLGEGYALKIVNDVPVKVTRNNHKFKVLKDYNKDCVKKDPYNGIALSILLTSIVFAS